MVYLTPSHLWEVVQCYALMDMERICIFRLYLVSEYVLCVGFRNPSLGRAMYFLSTHCSLCLQRFCLALLPQEKCLSPTDSATARGLLFPSQADTSIFKFLSLISISLSSTVGTFHQPYDHSLSCPKNFGTCCLFFISTPSSSIQLVVSAFLFIPDLFQSLQ